MKIQNWRFVSEQESSNAIKLKTLINCRHLQTLKQKLANQSQKISNFKNIASSGENPYRQEILKKKNKSNEQKRKHDLFQDSTDQNYSRRASDAHTMARAYFIQQEKTLANYRSQVFPSYKTQTRQSFQKIPYLKLDKNSLSSQTQASNKTAQQQSVSKNLKITTSTTTSSPSFIKKVEKNKSLAQLTTKYSKVHFFRQIKPQNRELNINDFKMIRFLQEGQFGSVHLARHLSTNFICALKKIPKKIFQNDADYINQLVREVKIQSFLDHPNIVRLYTCFHDADHVYLMLEYCSGGNLFSNMKKQQRLSKQKVRKYLKQICRAVEFMHKNDIIHRDLKPQNILLHQDLIKVCDFGWSINSPLMRETHCGTPLYSSPEIIQKKQYDSKVDVWNIGVMTYELLYGKLPFEIQREQDLIKIVQEDIHFQKNYPVSSAAKDFILQSLFKDPKGRASIKKLLDHQFFQL